MENEYMKRGYLLPEGCKDLTDVPKYKAKPAPTPPAPLPPIIGEMTVPSQMTVSELAAALTQKPFRIIADLMELGVFVTVKHQLDFDMIFRVMRKYGFTARRAS
jgi:hypothetical protein